MNIAFSTRHSAQEEPGNRHCHGGVQRNPGAHCSAGSALPLTDFVTSDKSLGPSVILFVHL